jgi:IS5 family transposase
MKRMARIQQTLASQTSFEKHGRKSKRELFLDHMEQVVPWSELLALVEPHYPKAGNGRQPVGVAIMLRTYFLQQWFSLSDPGMEEAFYESPVLRRFAGIDLGVAAAPDETTILRFRHLLEQHDLGGQMLDTVNHYLESKGIRISTGTIVDATIIHAPSSTKNSTGERDPEMHQTKKGNQWYFGAKAHIGVDSRETIVHSVCTSAASVADKHMLPDLLHGEERKVWGDGAYQGQSEAIRAAAPKAQDMTCRRTRYKNYVDEEAKRKNTTKARVRARVEHPFRILKRVFGFTKVRYRGIRKNHQWFAHMYRDPQGRWYATAELLAEARLLKPTGQSIRVGEEEFYPLDVYSGVSYRFDAAKQLLVIIISAENFQTLNIQASKRIPAEAAASDPGFFLNTIYRSPALIPRFRSPARRNSDSSANWVC